MKVDEISGKIGQLKVVTVLIAMAIAAVVGGLVYDNVQTHDQLDQTRVQLERWERGEIFLPQSGQSAMVGPDFEALSTKVDELAFSQAMGLMIILETIFNQGGATSENLFDSALVPGMNMEGIRQLASELTR